MTQRTFLRLQGCDSPEAACDQVPGVAPILERCQSGTVVGCVELDEATALAAEAERIRLEARALRRRAERMR